VDAEIVAVAGCDVHVALDGVVEFEAGVIAHHDLDGSSARRERLCRPYVDEGPADGPTTSADGPTTSADGPTTSADGPTTESGLPGACAHRHIIGALESTTTAHSSGWSGSSLNRTASSAPQPLGRVISKSFVRLVTTYVPASMSPISGSGGIVRASVGDAVGASVGDVGDGSSAVHAERPTDPSSPNDQIDVEAVVRRSTMTLTPPRSDSVKGKFCPCVNGHKGTKATNPL
jgi:hypothetical protein